MHRSSVKERVLALMADGEPRTIRRIAYLLNVGYSTVAQLVRDGDLIKIGEARSESPLQRRGQPVVRAKGTCPSGQPTKAAVT
jgi:hypothetical protein